MKKVKSLRSTFAVLLAAAVFLSGLLNFGGTTAYAAIIEQGSSTGYGWFTIFYDAAGGVGVPTNQRVNYSTSDDGQHYTKSYTEADLVLSSVVPTRSGYSFIGWAKNPLSAAADYQPSERYSPSDTDTSFTFYALWEAKPVDIAVTAPVVGSKPDKSAVGDADFEVGEVKWSPLATAFKEGKSYTAKVTLTAKSGTLGNFPAEKLTINGESATTVDISGNKLTLSYEFSPLTAPVAEDTAITEASISVTTPVVGAAPNVGASASGNSFNFVTDGKGRTVTWSPLCTKFKAGVAYTATVTVKANAGYTFTGITAANVNVNGIAADEIALHDGGETLTIKYTFAALN